MQQIVRSRAHRAPPATPTVPDRSGPLPTHLLFGTLLGSEGRKPPPSPQPRTGRRRTSVQLYLERVLWPTA